jgi:hypothetical protein
MAGPGSALVSAVVPVAAVVDGAVVPLVDPDVAVVAAVVSVAAELPVDSDVAGSGSVVDGLVAQPVQAQRLIVMMIASISRIVRIPGNHFPIIRFTPCSHLPVRNLILP